MFSNAVAFMPSRVSKRSPNSRSFLKLLNRLFVGSFPEPGYGQRIGHDVRRQPTLNVQQDPWRLAVLLASNPRIVHRTSFAKYAPTFFYEN